MRRVDLHHEDSLDFFQFWYSLSGDKSLTFKEALELFPTIPETLRRDIATIGAWVYQMEKVARAEQRRAAKAAAKPKQRILTPRRRR